MHYQRYILYIKWMCI